MSIWADRKHATAKSAKTLPALEGTLVSIYPINTGYLCVSRASLVEGGSPNEILQIPCFAFLLHHPVEGFVLFDIGIPSRFLPDEDLAERKMKPDSPRFFPTVTKGMNVNSQLAQAGIESLDKVILSHSISKDDLIDLMHLPTNSISVGVGMKLKLISRKDYGTDLDRKLIETNFDTGRTLGAGRLSALGPFERTIDMYGDGSIYLVDLPGPCEGHMGILTRTGRDRHPITTTTKSWTHGMSGHTNIIKLKTQTHTTSRNSVSAVIYFNCRRFLGSSSGIGHISSRELSATTG
ncbi:uncharacterized protein LOC134183456 isoform X2 [Corticium candelabrum]|uniref:uncharacterized protein LOC134183456 isoform X2 n=1 Tax=Corticium candelabrum TaxID=121492 RepID=UPI002E267799|nr:uncharacterized protein LOC134183456 isoform X2 [Corticium candelabrum]